MNSKIISLFFAAFLAFALPLTAYAAGENDYNAQWLDASGAHNLSEYIDDATKNYLEELGCEISDFESILSVSVESVFSLILGMLRQGWAQPMKGLVTATAAVILCGAATAFAGGNAKTESAVSFICGTGLITGIFAVAAESLTAGVSAIRIASTFEKALIPVLAFLLTASGNPTAAVSVQGAAFTAAQAVEAVACDAALPLSLTSGALGMLGSVLPSVRLSSVASLIRKVMTVSLSACAGLFSGFLTIKCVLASAADSVGFRGVRFAANTLIPVVGGAVSEAFGSISASAGLIKNTVAVYAVISLCLMCIPVVINFSLWILAMKIASCIAELIGASACGEIINHVSFVFAIMNAVIIFSLAVFVISAGLVIAVNSGN